MAETVQFCGSDEVCTMRGRVEAVEMTIYEEIISKIQNN